jgi:AcrR family transcriptional regulator
MAEQIYNSGICEKVEQILSQGKSIAAVASELGVNRATIYEWRDKHPEFDKAYQRGLDACQAFWENIGQNGITGEIKNFGGTPWMFTMKNRFRADYAEEKADKSAAETLVDKLIDKLVD